MALPLSGKVALVTGASRGIGSAIAKRLATDGASVVVNYSSSEAAALKVIQEIDAEGKGKATAVKADVSTVAEGNRLIEETVRLYGKLDILIFNAAFKKVGNLSAIDEEAFDGHFNANVKTPLFMTQTAAKYLKSGKSLTICTRSTYNKVSGGRVIFVTSSVTKTSAITPEYLIYTASKGADDQIVRVLAKDLGARGITVNAVAPGAVNTEFFQSDGKTDEFIQYVANMHPQKRLPIATEIAPLVVFLARDEAGWVNGQIIMVNGVSSKL